MYITLDFLNTLPEPYKTQIFAEITKQGRQSRLHDMVGNLAQAIDNAINWASTEQGRDYWKELVRKIRAGEDITPKDGYLDEIEIEFAL